MFFCFGSVSSFFLELFLLISGSILGMYQLGEFIFQCPIFVVVVVVIVFPGVLGVKLGSLFNVFLVS